MFTTYGKWYRNINFEFKGLAPNILIGDEIGNIHLLEMISSTVITSDIDSDGIRPYSTISLAIFGGEDGQIEPLIWLDQIRSPYTAINNESISHWNHVFTPFIVHALCDLPLVSIVRLKVAFFFCAKLLLFRECTVLLENAFHVLWQYLTGFYQ